MNQSNQLTNCFLVLLVFLSVVYFLLLLLTTNPSLCPNTYKLSLSFRRSISDYTNQPCFNKCQQKAKALAARCKILTVLDLPCRQYYWVEAGCSTQGQDYPVSNWVQRAPRPKELTIDKYCYYKSVSNEREVLWKLRNATSKPNKWIELNKVDSTYIDRKCGTSTEKKVVFSYLEGSLSIDLNDDRADGWYTYYNTQTKELWGQGSVVRVYFPFRCLGENLGRCTKGENTEQSALINDIGAPEKL